MTPHSTSHHPERAQLLVEHANYQYFNNNTMIDRLRTATNGLLANYRHLLGLDNNLVGVINLVTLLVGVGIVRSSQGTLVYFGAFLILAGVVGFADQLYGRVE